jgi:hypothetical protein
LAATSVEACIDQLLGAFYTYDRAVDVVSTFEMLFAVSQTELPRTVKHFERFPKVTAGDGEDATPDFSVVFHDGTGLAGEVARLALHDESVESLCRQLLRYDSLKQVPSSGGQPEHISYCDVLLLVPLDVGVPAIRRILHERMNEPTHWYSPSVAPCVVQFGFDQGRWVFQRPPDPSNGHLREEGRDTGINEWLDMDSIKVKPERFADIKAARPFINDSVDSLYLATLLWTKTFATVASRLQGPPPILLSVTAGSVGADLRSKFGPVKTTEVVRALELLRTAKLAEQAPDGTWQIAWEKLHSTREREVERILARRACEPPATSRPAALRRQLRGSLPATNQLSLLERPPS